MIKCMHNQLVETRTVLSPPSLGAGNEDKLVNAQVNLNGTLSVTLSFPDQAASE